MSEATRAVEVVHIRWPYKRPTQTFCGKMAVGILSYEERDTQGMALGAGVVLCEVCAENCRLAKKEKGLTGPVDTMVHHPSHYNAGRIEVIEFLEDQKLEPHEWNAVKYICRAKHKSARLQDLEKAIWYLRRKIEILSSAEQGKQPLRPNEMNR